jgi:hypothetical protein
MVAGAAATVRPSGRKVTSKAVRRRAVWRSSAVLMDDPGSVRWHQMPLVHDRIIS